MTGWPIRTNSLPAIWRRFRYAYNAGADREILFWLSQFSVIAECCQEMWSFIHNVCSFVVKHYKWTLLYFDYDCYNYTNLLNNS